MRKSVVQIGQRWLFYCFQVEITDLEPDTLEQLLKFIYTDKIEDDRLTTLACGLLTAADKYNVQRLKVSFYRGTYWWVNGKMMSSAMA